MTSGDLLSPTSFDLSLGTMVEAMVDYVVACHKGLYGANGVSQNYFGFMQLTQASDGGLKELMTGWVP